MSVEKTKSVSDDNSHTVATNSPIELREEIESERETAYQFMSHNIERRILEAKNRQEGIGLEEISEKFGL